MTVPTQTSRTVAGVINSVETLEGAGFLVRANKLQIAEADGLATLIQSLR